MSAPGGGLIAFRCACGKKLKMPASTAGRLAKCPKCAQPVRVPHPADAPSAAAPESDDPPHNHAETDRAASRGIDELILEDVKAPPIPRAPTPAGRVSPGIPAARRTTPSTTAPAAADVFELAPLPAEITPAEAAAAAELTQACPACGRGWPGVAKVCTDCGVYLATGKAIVTTQEDNLDETYMKAQSFLWYWSWVNFIGLFPLRSEAFGLRKPYVIRTIALATIIFSIAFFFSLWPNPMNGGTYGHLMLWGGQRDQSTIDWAEYAMILKEEGYTEAEISAEIAAEKRLVADEQHDFAYYQLLTHQFLHADFVHLFGNLVFLFLLGSRVNSLIGQTWTAIAYPLLGIAAAVTHLTATRDSPWMPMLGASGAISGLAGMYLVFFPLQRIHMVFWWRWGLIRLFELHIKFFTVRGFWLVLWYFGFDALYIYLEVEDGTAYWAHVGGFLAGIALALLLLLTRQVNGRGADLLTVLLGRRAWALVGRPRAT